MRSPGNSDTPRETDHAAGDLAQSEPHDDVSMVRKEVIAALDAERAAAVDAMVALGPGRRTAISGPTSRYRFSVARPPAVTTGAPIQLRLGSRVVAGTALGCDAGAIDLALADDVGPAVPPKAELLIEAPWLVERLMERVKTAFEQDGEEPNAFNLTNALRVLGCGEIVVSDHDVAPEYDNERAPLEEDQARAVECAFRAPVSVIVAPPGTGKTLTLGAIVEAAYRAGHRVLVTATSNAALDTLFAQVARRVATDRGFFTGAFLRVGDEVSRELRDQYGDRVVVSDVVQRLHPELHARLLEAQERVDAIAARLTPSDSRAPRGSAPHRRTPAQDTPNASLERELASARVDLDECRRALRECGRMFVRRARVVGATLTRTYLDRALANFDTVVVDEASMALTPAVFIAAGLARQHVVLAGDPYQLSTPVRATSTPSAWLRESVFERLSIPSMRAALEEGESVEYATYLTVQRRSAEPICALERAVWYGEGLRTAPEVFARERQRTNLLFGGAALCYIDTAALDPKAVSPWGGTYANCKHAMLIADMIALLDSAGELADSDPRAALTDSQPNVFVLSHYRGQVAELTRQLKPWRKRGVAIRTVHRAQGSEATTVILDLTLTGQQHTRNSNIFTARRPTELGSRLTCTGCSRARSRLVIVGDFAAIEQSVNPHSVLGRIYSHLVEHGYRIPLADVIGTRAKLGIKPADPRGSAHRLSVVR